MSKGIIGSGVEVSDALDPDRNLLEVCCEEESALGRSTADSRGCGIIRVHKKRNQLKECTLDESVRFIRKDGCTLDWVAIPVSGGSCLQF